LSTENSTHILGDKDRQSKPSFAVTSDVSALYEIIRSNPDTTVRKNAVAHLLSLVERGQDVDSELIKALFNAEKDITVAAELKRLLNKLQILQKYSSDPAAKYDHKLTDVDEENLQKEIHRLRSLYDNAQGEKGSFDRKYKILGQIAKGGMGRILQGVRLSDHKPVAIKYLLLEQLAQENSREKMVARFEREGKLLTKRLKHRNIVQGYEYGESNGEHFLIMEYVDGGSLEDIIKAKPLELAAFKDISIQLCDAVEYLHRNDVIHRDIKPGNILLTADVRGSLQIKLCDFGLSKDKRDSKLSRFSFQAGTDEYSSPQQLQDARTADERDDMFSMGKTFYQMLTGRTFDGAEEYLTVKEFDPELSEKIDEIIMKCIEPEREKRIQSISTLRNELKKKLILGGI
jgi:serine/threonine protein kinase